MLTAKKKYVQEVLRETFYDLLTFENTFVESMIAVAESDISQTTTTTNFLFLFTSRPDAAQLRAVWYGHGQDGKHAQMLIHALRVLHGAFDTEEFGKHGAAMWAGDHWKVFGPLQAAPPAAAFGGVRGGGNRRHHADEQGRGPPAPGGPPGRPKNKYILHTCIVVAHGMSPCA
jgi:hypothetical protein